MRPDATLSIVLPCPPERALAYLADPRHWPAWSVPACDGIFQQIDGVWLILSTVGSGRLTVASGENRVDFREMFDEGEWQLHCRVSADEAGTRLEVRIPRPEFCDRLAFEDFVEMARIRLKRLATVLVP